MQGFFHRCGVTPQFLSITFVTYRTMESDWVRHKKQMRTLLCIIEGQETLKDMTKVMSKDRTTVLFHIGKLEKLSLVKSTLIGWKRHYKVNWDKLIPIFIEEILDAVRIALFWKYVRPDTMDKDLKLFEKKWRKYQKSKKFKKFMSLKGNRYFRELVKTFFIWRSNSDMRLNYGTPWTFWSLVNDFRGVFARIENPKIKDPNLLDVYDKTRAVIKDSMITQNLTDELIKFFEGKETQLDGLEDAKNEKIQQ